MAKKKRRNSTRYLKDIMEKRCMFLIVLIILLFTVISFRLFKLQVLDNDKYLNALAEVVEKPILGESAPRGRIYDRNHNLLVDNKAIKTIYYKKEKGVTTKEEIELAYQDVLKQKEGYLSIQLTKIPSGIKHIRLSHKSVDFLIEDKNKN